MFTGKPPWSNLQHLQLIYRFYLNEPPQYVLPDNVDSDAKHFLNLTFNFNYEQRPTAEALLNHPFLNSQ
jgi:mitogen-activated protein kinase kinase kinase